MAGHTPGPWGLYARTDGWQVYSESRSHVGYAYASVMDPPEVGVANAALIVSAPELLEALEWLLACVEADPEAESYPGYWDERLLLACGAAHTALRKARGEA